MASRIDPAQVRHIAHLARLELTDEEVSRYTHQLGAILGYMDELGRVPTDGIEPTAHAVQVENVFRDDVPTTPLGVEKVLANAPEKESPYFKVPKVLDQESP